MNKLLELENDGLNMAAEGEYLYIRGMRTMYKYRLSDMSLAAENTVFKKDGKSRSFGLCDKYVFLIDFCDLYILDKNDLSLVMTMRLGSDLSSDLGVVRFNSENAYINIRNGKMAVVNLSTLAVSKHEICQTSSWEHCVVGEQIFTGTVEGELVETNAADMSLARRAPLCKKNIYGIVHEDGILYTVSQDTSIKAVSAQSLEPSCVVAKAVRGMTRILGICGEKLVIADRGVTLWDKKTLAQLGRIDIPTGQFNKGAALLGNTVYGSDHSAVYLQTV